MIYRALDDNEDYAFGQNKQHFVSDIDAVRQAVYTRLKLLLEEWWEDVQDGLPLFQSILGARTGKGQQAIDIIIQDRIRGTTCVTDVFQYESTLDEESRKYSFQCQIGTLYGITTIDKEVSY